MRIPDKESMTVEFKSELSGPVGDGVIVDNVVAFANTSGGTLFLGVEDDGEPTGVSREHGNVNQLAAFVFNHTVPPVQVRPAVIETDGGRVVAIDVDMSMQLVATSMGRVLHRVLKADGEPQVVTMFPHEFISRLSSIGQYDYSDQPAPDSDLGDLDPAARDMLRESIARQHADDQLLELSDEGFDGALGLTTRRTRDGDPVPTVAGVLMAGTKEALRLRMPTATATFQVMRGGSPVVDCSLRLPLASMIDRVCELFEPWNAQTEVMLGVRHANFPDYGHAAFREALANAFCHRDYTIMRPVRLQLDEAGLTVASPGGFVRGVGTSNLLSVSPTPRNIRLADILKRCGFAERTGRGVDRIYADTAASGRPLPDYSQSGPDEVVLFLRASRPDEGFVRMVDEIAVRRGAPLPVEDLVVLAALNQHGRMDAEEACEATSLDRERVAMALDELTGMGAVAAGPGTDRKRKYSLSAKVGDDGAARSENGFEARTLELLRARGPLSVAQVAEAMPTSYATASRLLKRLLAEGKITHQGRARNSRYSAA